MEEAEIREDALPQENSFVTTELPEEEKIRRNLAAKRMFYLVLSLILVCVGLLTWEIIELANGGFYL